MLLRDPIDPNFGKCHSIEIVGVDSFPRLSVKAWITSEYNITLQMSSFIPSYKIVSAILTSKYESKYNFTLQMNAFIASNERALCWR